MFYFCLDTGKDGFYNKSMKTITKEFEFKSTYDLARLGDPEDLLFFDIETTGLSSKKDMIYLIGCVYVRDGCWHMKQWFAESPDAEGEILLHFFLFASRFSTLVHFNGTTFDLPFLRERAARYHTPVSGREPESLDIYRKVKPLKTILGLPDCRQKTLEAFLGNDREDLYDGGQLINFYWQYLRTGEASLYEALLLHNEEDVKGLPALLALFSYEDFFCGGFHVQAEELSHYRTADGTEARELFVTCKCDCFSLPIPCSFSVGDCRLVCRGDMLIFRLPLFEGTLRYFFSNYCDYYYLPLEDRAIHKSVAAFVEKTHRRKATAKTCYQKRTGCFLPIPEAAAGEHPVFYREYKQKPSYIEYEEGLFKDPVFLQQFLLATLPK